MSSMKSILEATIDTYHIWLSSKGREKIGNPQGILKDMSKARGIFYNFFLKIFLENKTYAGEFLPTLSRHCLAGRLSPEDFIINFGSTGEILGIKMNDRTYNYYNVTERTILISSIRSGLEEVAFKVIKISTADSFDVKAMIDSRQAIENFSFKV